MALELTEQNFAQEVESFDSIALVDFWAPWCGPCQQQGLIIEELSEDLKDNAQVKIGKVNVDENPDLSQRFNIRSIPALIFFKSGKPDGQLVGVNPKDVLKKKIEELLK